MIVDQFQQAAAPRAAGRCGTSRRAFGRVEALVLILALGACGWYGFHVLSTSRVARYRQACLNNLGQIGQALQRYLDDHEQRWPAVAKLRSFQPPHSPTMTLPDVLKNYTKNQSDLYHCPADVRVLEAEDPLARDFPRRTTWYDTEGLSYGWWWGQQRAGQKVGEEFTTQARGLGESRSDQLLLQDFELFHVGDGGGPLNTLNADLRARTVEAGAVDE